jgi:hypothetical protein
MTGAEGTIPGKKGAGDGELLAALSGKRAARESALASRTRRSVLGTLGLLKEQEAGRKRTRSIALAGLVLAGLGMAPFAWRLADDLFGGEHICDLTTQLSLLICVFCPALVAAVLVAGWMRRS